MIRIVDEVNGVYCAATGKLLAEAHTGNRVAETICEHCGRWERVSGNFCGMTGEPRKAPLGLGSEGA